MLLICVGRLIRISLHLFQCTLQVSVDHERDVLLPAMIVEPLVVLTGQSDRAVIYFSTILSVAFSFALDSK